METGQDIMIAPRAPSPAPLGANPVRPSAAETSLPAALSGRAPALPPPGAGARRIPRPAPAPELLLGRDERAVILLSLRDRRSSLAASRGAARFRQLLFGLRRLSPPLAGVRLEALRRYALLYRLEAAALPLEEDDRLYAAGFSEREAAAARALVDDRYQPEPDRPRGRWTLGLMLAAGAAAAALLDRWISAQVDDAVGGLLVTTLLVTWIASFTALGARPRLQQTRATWT